MTAYQAFLIWALRVVGLVSLVVGLIMFVQTSLLTLQGVSATVWDISSSAFTLLSVVVTSVLPLAAAEILSVLSKSGSPK